MRSLIVYNWKTYIPSEDRAVVLAESLRTHRADSVVCPSAAHIPAVRDVLREKDIHIGAQDISVSAESPQTGSHSGEQLRNLGAAYVIVGHAETRENGVTNTMVARKTVHALHAGIVPVVCVSERHDHEQRQGDEVTAQLTEILNTVPESSRFVVAYEPTRHIGADDALETESISAVAGRFAGGARGPRRTRTLRRGGESRQRGGDSAARRHGRVSPRSRRH